MDSLFSKHDAVSKLGFVRNRLSSLDKDDLEKASSIIAFRMFNSSVYEITKDELYKEYEIIKKLLDIHFDNEKLTYDLTIVVNILTVNGDYFSFPHILLQEYLAALFISSLDNSLKTNLYAKITNSTKSSLSSSFFTFLFELDYRPFIKGYLIPSLKILLDKLENNRLNTQNNTELLEFIRLNFFNENDVDEIKYENIKQLIDKLIGDVSEDNNLLKELFDTI